MEREDLNYYLQYTPDQLRAEIIRLVLEEAAVQVIQKPTAQTLLVPVHDPINGGSFMSGEVLVTSAIVKVNDTNGWAMVMDQNIDLARDVATLDGAWAAGVRLAEISELAERGRQQVQAREQELAHRTHATRVSFDLL